MEEFYKTYLLSNRENFNKYTNDWRKANTMLIYMSLRAKKSRITKNIKDKISVLR